MINSGLTLDYVRLEKMNELVFSIHIDSPLYLRIELRRSCIRTNIATISNSSYIRSMSCFSLKIAILVR